MELETHKREFIEFMVRSGALRFGDFTLKSGRRSPYFIDTGAYGTGSEIERLGEFYALALRRELGDAFDVVFGPAYKGIPLAVAAAAALARAGGDVGFCFDRKEAKDHGEGGSLIGHRLADGDRVVIVEDVTTAGTSIRETVPKLRAAARIRLAGLLVSVDRLERGTDERTALAQIRDELAMPAFAIVTIADVLEHLRRSPVDGELVVTPEIESRMRAYLAAHAGRS